MQKVTPPQPPSVLLWHDPSCKRSARALELLQLTRCEVTLYDFIDEPPSADDLRAVLTQLSTPEKAWRPVDIARVRQPLFSELGLKDADDATLLDGLSANPTLIARPIVEVPDRMAILADPPEAVIQVLLPEMPAGLSVSEMMRHMMRGTLTSVIEPVVDGVPQE